MTRVEGAGDSQVEVRGYRLRLDRRYHPDTHMWAMDVDAGTQRIGLDPLGVETNGTLAQLSFVPPGAVVMRGQAFGQLEAAKFVGPLVSPLSGVVIAVNESAMQSPALVEADPLGAGWLVDMRPDSSADELRTLLSEAKDIVGWFEAKVDEYRLRGVIAE